MKILLIEDEPAIADTVVYALQSEGYEVEWQSTAEAGLGSVRQGAPDLVILDIGLPDMNGFDAFGKLRAIVSSPVIFLTARNVEVDKVTGLEMGADDYVVKPFSPRELTARVRAVLRRVNDGEANNTDNNRYIAGPFHIDYPGWVISYKNSELDLTHHEFKILSALLKHPGQIFSREQLLYLAWESPEHRLDRTVDAHIKNIRAKLREIDSQHDPIRTKRGVGYYIHLLP
ncbi:MAG: two-component system response regulator CreB [Gammaproteobacteria bacterium]|nr:two-component system response regulator CreB [Gammaproteobacteria bacterium]